MDGIDKELERRVWQRVRGRLPEPEVTRKTLAAEEFACAQMLEQLARRFQGRAGRRLLEMARGERSHGRYLGGRPEPTIRTNGNRDMIGTLEAVAEGMERRAQMYGQWAVNNPADELLRRLAREERHRHGLLRELIGWLRGKRK